MFKTLRNFVKDLLSRNVYAEHATVTFDEDQEIHVHNYNTEEIIRLQNRERELLQHNNYLLQMYRDKKAENLELRIIIGDLDNLLVAHNEHTRYQGSPLERAAVLAGENITDG